MNLNNNNLIKAKGDKRPIALKKGGDIVQHINEELKDGSIDRDNSNLFTKRS